MYCYVKRKNTSLQICEYESRDEQYRCGRIRSSGDADVMSVERRGSVIKLLEYYNQKMGGFYERGEIISDFTE